LGHDQGDDEVASKKLSEAAGISINSASTLITFVPVAFARVWLSSSPLRFPPTYVRCDESGQPVKRRYFEANPAFQEAHRQAQRLMNENHQLKDFWPWHRAVRSSGRSTLRLMMAPASKTWR